MLTRGPCANGRSFGSASRCYGPWARSLDDRTSFKFTPPTRDQPGQIYRRAVGSIARSTRPATPRRRVAYLGWADRVRRSSVSLDTACITALGGFAHVEERSSRRARGRPRCRSGTARSCWVENKVGAGGSFQTADAAAAENEGLRGEVAGREGQDRREGPHRLSEIHGRLSEKGT